jgi:ribonucleoside-diphosphate reductase alpha chain
MSTIVEQSTGLEIPRYFATEGDPYEQTEWELRTATITNAKGEVIFEQKDVRIPKSWTQRATNIVVSKYFYGKLGTPQRETGVDQLIKRVVATIRGSGIDQGYFTLDEADVFADELAYLLLNQYTAFNSPVWFNAGCSLYEPHAQATSWHWDPATGGVVHEATGYFNPQCSACFINSIEDSMEGIMRLATTEAMLFKFGSGTGTNFSPLRSSKEGVSGGGTASGPLSFMKGLDAFAGVIKSGGKTRRAAKMAILNVDHPDIEEFIDCKLKEDRKAQALMREGYDGTSGPDSEAYSSVFYQNANNSVRVSDSFMDAYLSGHYYDLHAVKDGHTIDSLEARKVMHKVAQATWDCGDPGMQFDDTINKWHTCKDSGRINASNPCSEYMFLDDSACNLASFNLMKFVHNGKFNSERFRRACATMTIAMDIIVDLSGYPTESIAKNSHDFRPLGLGYANLGALLMSMGLPYDSAEGRRFAAAITGIMTAQAYLTSTAISRKMKPLASAGGFKYEDPTYGSFPGFADNKKSFLDVMRLHLQAAEDLNRQCSGTELGSLSSKAKELWDSVVTRGTQYGFRNAQVTVLAPTGTIGFMMDCDTTGIEPELALVKYKKMVGGGQMKIVNEGVEKALANLGYSEPHLSQLISYVDAHGSLEGSTLKDEDLPVFDTAFRPAMSKRSIHYMGHIKMMAATQPFLSGAISKTVNMPNDASVEDIEKAYSESWKLGLKAVAIYRDGSKSNQVLVTKKEEKKPEPFSRSETPIGGLVTDEALITILEHRAPGKPTDDLLAMLKETFNGFLPVAEPVETTTPIAHAQDDSGAPPVAVRHRLPNTRPAVTHKFSIAGHDGYLTVGLYKSGQPGEIFITMAKEGSTISGFMDSFALVFSVALQHGVPLETLISKLEHTRFEPSGWTGDPNVGYAKSIMDYLARWLKIQYSDPANAQVRTTSPTGLNPAARSISSVAEISDSPACSECGCITVRNGSCYKCLECGSTTGCS